MQHSNFSTPVEAKAYLEGLTNVKDADIDLGEAALAMGLMFLPGLSVDRYRQHLKKLPELVRTEYDALLKAGGGDSAALQVKALVNVIHTQLGYEGDGQNYDDLDNANIIRVIERRKGLPVALGILYIIAGRGLGWKVDGLNFPGHFILRVEKDGSRLVIDPFHNGKVLMASDLRSLLKSIAGQRAELAHQYYDAVSPRDVLVRLENNLKTRLIEAEDYAQALKAVEAIRIISPLEYRVFLEEGVLAAKLGDKDRALSALELYIQKVPDHTEKQQARDLLQQIKIDLS